MRDAFKAVAARNERIRRNERITARQAETRRIIYAKQRAW